MKISNILKGNFIRNVSIVASGSVFSQIIVLTLMPLVTRLYGPQAYGVLGSFNAVVATISPIAALTLPNAIVMPKRDTEALSVALLSFRVLVIISVAILLFSILLNDEISQVLNLQEISSYLVLVPVAVFLIGLLSIFSQWLIRKNNYKLYAKSMAYQPIIIYTLMVIFGILYSSPIVLIIITTFQAGVSVLFIWWNLKSTEKYSRPPKIEMSLSYMEALDKYKDFPKYRAPEAIISSFSNNIPIFVLTSFLGPAYAGFFSLSKTALMLPSRMIGKAVEDVFFARIARAVNEKHNIISLLIKATLGMLGLGILPFGIVIIIGPELFTFVFGEEWEIAGSYGRWLALLSLFAFINRPAVKALTLINAQKFHLKFTILMTIAKFLALLIGILVFDDDLIAVAMFSITSAILYLLLTITTISKCYSFQHNS